MRSAGNSNLQNILSSWNSNAIQGSVVTAFIVRLWDYRAQCFGFEFLPVENYFILGFEPWPDEDHFTLNQRLENIIVRGRCPAAKLPNETVVSCSTSGFCASRQSRPLLRGSMRMVSSILIGLFGFQYPCLGSVDYQAYIYVSSTV